MGNFEHLPVRLAAGETILIDGGMGSELGRRGVTSPNTWSGGPMLTHPELVRGIHQEYIEAGADFIITNMFSTGRDVLEPNGLEHKVAEAKPRPTGWESKRRCRQGETPGQRTRLSSQPPCPRWLPSLTGMFRCPTRERWRPTGSNSESLPRVPQPVPLKLPARLQPQVELARGVVVRHPALEVLGDDVDVLETPLDGVALEDRAGAAQVVRRVHHLGGKADGVGGGDPQRDTVLDREGAVELGALPDLADRLAQKGLRRAPGGHRLANLPLGCGVVAQLAAQTSRHLAARDVYGRVQCGARHAQSYGGEAGREQQRGG